MGVDNLALEALKMGCESWVCGITIAFPKESQKIYNPAQAGCYKEAIVIYQWFRPLLDLDVSTILVQQIKLAEAIELGSTFKVRVEDVTGLREFDAIIRSIGGWARVTGLNTLFVDDRDLFALGFVVT
jgi:hypothetical protein